MLPRIRRLGYNAIQIMAVQEPAYYGSFGYHGACGVVVVALFVRAVCSVLCCAAVGAVVSPKKPNTQTKIHPKKLTNKNPQPKITTKKTTKK